MWQVVKTQRNADGRALKKTFIGIPTTRERAERVFAYHTTKEQRANVDYAIVDVTQNG